MDHVEDGMDESLQATRQAVADQPQPSFDTDAGWQRMGRRVRGAGESLPHPGFARWPVRWFSGPVIGAAAGIVLTVGLWMHYEVPVQPLREFSTVAGNRATIHLRDGTQVILGPASVLRLSPDYGRGGRSVSLTGEAYFVVVHDQWHPFAVLANNTTITDVGTEFDVRAYDADLRVAVAKGEISLRSQPPLPLTPSPVAFGAGRGNGFNGVREGGAARAGFTRAGLSPAPTTTNDTEFLTAGDVAEVTDAGFTVTHHADIASATAWTQGQLVFADTPMPEVIKTLNRTFGLQVTVTDSTLAAHHVTASFVSESPDEVLTLIARIIGADVRRMGVQIMFVPRHAAAAPRYPVTTASRGAE